MNREVPVEFPPVVELVRVEVVVTGQVLSISYMYTLNPVETHTLVLVANMLIMGCCWVPVTMSTLLLVKKFPDLSKICTPDW
jgi:hypothetical protein